MSVLLDELFGDGTCDEVEEAELATGVNVLEREGWVVAITTDELVLGVVNVSMGVNPDFVEVAA